MCSSWMRINAKGIFEDDTEFKKNMKHLDWILDLIRHVTTTYRRRVAGSRDLRGAQKYMGGLLSSVADRVSLEDFTLSPHAFIGSIPLQAALGLAGAICFLLSGFARVLMYISLALYVITFISMIFEYILYLPLFDFFYPKAEGLNLYAERKASGETKKRIILCGHADAAFEMPMFKWQNPPLFYSLIFLAYGCVIATPVFCIISIASSSFEPSLLLRIIMMVLSLTFIPFLGFADWKTVAPGANDNMTGSAIAMSILKELADNDERFVHTDVCCLITDGEESGLRGATAFARAHMNELKEVETIVIAIDTINDLSQMAIYQRGINWTQKNSDEVCALLKQAGKACGMDLPFTKAYPGATDAEAFSRLGIKAAALCAIDHVPGDYYHSRNDTYDNMHPECIDAAREIAKKAVELYAYSQTP